MAKTQMWMVRAGRNAVYADEFVDQGVVALGWHELGPLDSRISREDLAQRYAETYPRHSKGKAALDVGQVHRFVVEMAAGDAVCTYDSDQRRYCLGEVASDCSMRDHALSRYREVKWTRHVLRDTLTAATRNSLGAIMSLFVVPDAAAQELLQKASSIDEPLGEVARPKRDEQEASEDHDFGSVDLDEVASRAAEYIEDRIARLDWDELQELCAGILRAMGYRTEVAAKGPDRGVDISASPDGLGLKEPRIFVEVKHRMGQAMGSSEIRAFLGGRQAGDRCLYVSTGGFTKDARYEAERSAIPVTLISLPKLRELVIENYEALDPVVASMIPLERIYLPSR